MERLSLHVELAKLSSEDMKAVKNMRLLEGSDTKKMSSQGFSLKFNSFKRKNAARKDRKGEEETWKLFHFYPMIESAVTWLCFSPNSEQIITTSKDGSMRIWNINVRYHLDEDPKTLKVFSIPLQDSNGTTLHYDRLSVSPDGKILVATHGSMLQWLCAETGKVLDTVDKAHDGDITDIVWAPRAIRMGDKRVMALATASIDKKVKLWAAPPRPS